RLGIGRAIIHDPQVLVLDEPAVGLDPEGRVRFRHLARQLNGQGKTVLSTSHLLHGLEEMCTSIAIIERGRLLRSGRLGQILGEGVRERRVRIMIASPGFALVEWLSRRESVTGVTGVAPIGAQFSFAGGEAELASLVKALVVAGASVYAVEPVGETLEKVVMGLARGE